MALLNDDSKIGITNIRRSILDLLQSVFAEDPVYKWTSNPNTRKIDIVNEFSTGTPEIEKYPKIVMTRGDLSLRNVSLNRSGDRNIFLQPDTRHIQDLASGTIILNILSKQLIESEQIAEKVFFSLLSLKEEVRWSHFFLKFTDITLGSIQVVAQDSDIRVFQIPIYIRYDKEINFVKSYDYYDVEMYVGDKRQWQTTDFWIVGNLVYFLEAPSSGIDITMSYFDRDTMEGITESPLYPADGERTVFPFSNQIYGPYYIVSGIDYETYSASGVDIFYNSYTLYGDDIQVTQEAGPRVHRQGHSYILPGYIGVTEGQINYVPPFYVSNAPGQVTKLSKVSHSLNYGGSATCHVLVNDSVVPAYSGVVVTSGINTLDATDIYLQDGDSVGIKVAEVNNNPQNLSFTIFLDYIQ